MDKKELFNAVAPLHIYFNADLKYKRQALKGWRWLKEHKDQIRDYFPNTDFLFARKLDDLDHFPIWRAYNRLMEEIVTERFPNAEPEFDYFGARQFRIGDRIILCGDAYDCYAFYLDYEALDEYLQDVAA